MYKITIEKINLIDCGLDIHTFPLGFKSTGLTHDYLISCDNTAQLLIAFNNNESDVDLIYFPVVYINKNNEFKTSDGIYIYEQIELTEEEVNQYLNYYDDIEPQSYKDIDFF